jgi:hypothetical protein
MKNIETAYGTIQITETTQEDVEFNDYINSITDGPAKEFEHGYYATFISGGRTVGKCFGKTDCEAIEAAITEAAMIDARKEIQRLQQVWAEEDGGIA